MRCENPIGKPFYELSEVDSSNNYAMRMVQAQLAEHGNTWFAHHQIKGKGQRGKVWKADPGQNLMMSCVLQPAKLTVDNQFILNAAVALACFDFINKYVIDKCCIKWPNDIYWEDRKAGGILIENVLKGEQWKYSIVGIGLNINQTLFPENLRNPVSLKQITGKTFDVISLAKELCIFLDHRWKQISTSTFNVLLNEYSSHLYKINQQITFIKDNEQFAGAVKGVTEKGNLIIEETSGEKMVVESIEWVLP